jgi:dienelactone hydrolase
MRNKKFEAEWEDAQLTNQLSIRETRLHLQMEDITLDGHLAVPQNSRAVVIFAHGSGSSRHSPRNRSVAKHLNEARLATLLFDLLTEEEQSRDQASGQFRFDIALLARRLSEVVNSVTRSSETTGLKIGLFGASTGAAAALITAAERINEVAGGIAGWPSGSCRGITTASSGSHAPHCWRA